VQGHPELEKVISTRPSASAYDALGACFGQRKQFACAFSAFESALRLEPNSWEAHAYPTFGLSLNPERPLSSMTRQSVPREESWPVSARVLR
jgi:hypothetical protein